MRCLRLTFLLAVLTFLALGLGPRKADAGACRSVGLSNECVKSADVKNNNLKATDLKDEPGADFSSDDQSISLTGDDTIVRSVTITAPRSGVVVVYASGYFNFNSVEGLGRCSITTGSTLSSSHLVNEGGDDYGAFGTTRGYTVGRGSTTFNLVCDEYSGNITLYDTSITAIYTPTRY
jgi:hypothetical protein